jgi:hypothetical protein
MKIVAAAVAATFVLLPVVAQAQTPTSTSYRCTGKDARNTTARRCRRPAWASRWSS